MFFRILFSVLLLLMLGWNLLLTALSLRQRKKPLPENVSDVYAAEEYARWRDYSAAKRRVSLVEYFVDTAVLLVLFTTDLLSRAYACLPGGEAAKSLLLMTAYTALLTVFTVPFDWIRAMRIEERYGFNRSTGKTFVGDQIKNFLVGALLNDALVLLALLLYRALGNAAFPATFAVLAVFVIVFSMLSTTFQRLYNKFTPLPEGELRDTLTKLFTDAGYQLSEIEVMDASKRTTKANAYCTGLGSHRRIVLYDNLVNGYTPDEITAVFAHELGHYRHHDTVRLTACSVLQIGVMTALIAALVLIPGISQAFGFPEHSVVFAVIALMSALMEPVLAVFAIPVNLLTRRCEYRADASASACGYGDALLTALKKLMRDSLSDLNPHPFVVAVEHNHPTLSQRIAAVERLAGRSDGR